MTPSDIPISADDRELLSAFLDNQVTPAERQALEQRLAGEPALRGELDELRMTRAMLRDLPPMRAPRSFTIDPATAPERRSWFSGLMPVLFGLGGTVAAFALVVLIMASLGRGGSVATTSSAPAMEQAAAAATANPYDSGATGSAAGNAESAYRLDESVGATAVAAIGGRAAEAPTGAAAPTAASVAAAPVAPAASAATAVTADVTTADSPNVAVPTAAVSNIGSVGVATAGKEAPEAELPSTVAFTAEMTLRSSESSSPGTEQLASPSPVAAPIVITPAPSGAGALIPIGIAVLLAISVVVAYVLRRQQ